MSISIPKAGFQSSIQDNGRTGAMHLSISQSGAMDQVAFQFSNYLVGNPENTPAIEMTMIGSTIRFNEPYLFALCGANFQPQLNGVAIEQSRPVFATSGDILTLPGCQHGARCYLAIKGIWNSKYLLGSAATQVAVGYAGHQLADGDAIEIQSPYANTSLSDYRIRDNIKRYSPHYSGHYLLRIVASAETHLFSEAQKTEFTQQIFEVSTHSNRMGIRLSNSELRHSPPISSTGLSLGSIQITPSGMPIISGPDGQTTGGYPRIASILHADLSLLGQLKYPDKITFQWVNEIQAQHINTQKAALLAELMN